MGLTESQIKNLWLTRQQGNNVRYQFMSVKAKKEFNDELMIVFEEVKQHLIAVYGSEVVDYNTQLGIEGDGVVDTSINADIPPPPGTRILIIGMDKNNLPLTVTLKSNYLMYTNDNNRNLNFYSGDSGINIMDSERDTNGLREIWVYDGDYLVPGTVVINKVTITKYPTRTMIRFQNNMTTWDPLLPDTFEVNKWFLEVISNNMALWVNKLDPTQRVKWISGDNGITFVMMNSNLTPLDQGLNQKVYDPDHPERISGVELSLISSGGGIWVWGIGSDYINNDDTYRITIRKQVDNTYLHSVSGMKITDNEWFDRYVGIPYAV